MWVNTGYILLYILGSLGVAVALGKVICSFGSDPSDRRVGDTTPHGARRLGEANHVRVHSSHSATKF